MNRLTQRDVRHTLREILRIPHEALAYGSPAREALNTLARAEYNVSVYEKCYSGVVEWTVWLQPAHPWQVGDHTLAEWQRDYVTLTAEALARQAARNLR